MKRIFEDLKKVMQSLGIDKGHETNCKTIFKIFKLKSKFWCENEKDPFFAGIFFLNKLKFSIGFLKNSETSSTPVSSSISQLIIF